MLTQLATIKSRLALLDATYDALLTAVIQAVSTRFDHETHRTLARTENATHEFDPTDTEILVPCYPVQSVSKFELKSSEAAGWQEVSPTPDYLLRSACIISLPSPLDPRPSSPTVARVTYTGGYVLPGAPAAPGQTPLPADVEQAAVEQVAAWFYNRTHLGLKTLWVHEGDYHQFLALDLLPEVRAVLKTYARISL